MNTLDKCDLFFPFSENPKQDECQIEIDGQIRSPPPDIAKPSEAFYQKPDESEMKSNSDPKNTIENSTVDKS